MRNNRNKRFGKRGDASDKPITNIKEHLENVRKQRKEESDKQLALVQSKVEKENLKPTVKREKNRIENFSKHNFAKKVDSVKDKKIDGVGDDKVKNIASKTPITEKVETIKNVVESENNAVENDQPIKYVKSEKEIQVETAVKTKEDFENKENFKSDSVVVSKEKAIEMLEFSDPIAQDESFPEMLLKAKTNVASAYNSIKNYVFQYTGVRNLLFKECEIFVYGSDTLLMLSIQDNGIRLSSVISVDKVQIKGVTSIEGNTKLPFNSFIDVSKSADVNFALRLVIMTMNEFKLKNNEKSRTEDFLTRWRNVGPMSYELPPKKNI